MLSCTNGVYGPEVWVSISACSREPRNFADSPIAKCNRAQYVWVADTRRALVKEAKSRVSRASGPTDIGSKGFEVSVRGSGSRAHLPLTAYFFSLTFAGCFSGA